jgi:hypothetical protein
MPQKEFSRNLRGIAPLSGAQRLSAPMAEAPPNDLGEILRLFLCWGAPLTGIGGSPHMTAEGDRSEQRSQGRRDEPTPCRLHASIAPSGGADSQGDHALDAPQESTCLRARRTRGRLCLGRDGGPGTNTGSAIEDLSGPTPESHRLMSASRRFSRALSGALALV